MPAGYETIRRLSIVVLNAEKLSLTLSGNSEKLFRDVTFELSEGETGLVSGRSGSGKTLLGLTLCGYLPLWIGKWKLGGKLSVLGTPLIQGKVRKETGIVLENPYSQISGLKQTVFEELAFPLECRGIQPPVITDAIARIAAEFEISALLERHVKTLSGGELQRIIIAAALISGPRFLFLDRLMTEIDTGFRPHLLDIISSSAKVANGAALLAEDSWLLPEHRYDMTLPLGAEDTFDPAGIPIPAKITPGGKVLSIESLSFGFNGGAPVLRDVSFSVSGGELKRISGPNGAGKTTLARLIAGIIEPSSGDIVLDGISFGTVGQSEKMALSGLALQNPGLHFCRKTVREEIALAEKWGNAPSGLTEILGIDPLLDRHPLELKHAEKKRLGIALAYGERRKVIILDEPSQYQDTDGFGKIMYALNYMRGEGKAVLLISHDPRFDGLIPASNTIRLSRADTG